jgi:hypothetical protein
LRLTAASSNCAATRSSSAPAADGSVQVGAKGVRQSPSRRRPHADLRAGSACDGSASIRTTVSGGVARRAWRGREDRSRKSATPSARNLATHLHTVRGQTPTASLNATLNNPAHHDLSTHWRQPAILAGVRSVPKNDLGSVEP